MAWICLQFVIFPFNAWSTTYFLFGIAEATMAVLWLTAVRRA